MPNQIDRSASHDSSAHRRLRDFNLAWLVLASLFGFSLIIWWHGLGPHDETRYIDAAIGWLTDGMRLGPRHWDLRHLYVLPMAASFTIFGKNEFAASLPSILYAAGLVAITYCYGRRILGEAEALIAGGLVATSAFFVAIPIEVEVYGAETFFGAMAIWLYAVSGQEHRRSAFMFYSGVFCGLAWTLRETSIYIPTALGILALSTRSDRFVSVIALSLGFGCVLIAELIFYYVSAGDPLHRYKIDLWHRRGEPTLVSFSDDRFTFWRHLTRPITDSVSAPFVGPFLLIAMAISAVCWNRIWRKRGARRQTLLYFSAASVMGLIFCGYIFYQAMPQYYPILPYAALLISAVGIVECYRRVGRFAASSVALAIFTANIVVSDFKILNYYNEARYLVDYALRLDEPIFTDSGTARRAYALLALKGIGPDDASKRIAVADDPPACGLFFETHRAKLPDDTKTVLIQKEVLRQSFTRALLLEFGVGGEKFKNVLAQPRPVSVVRNAPDKLGDRSCKIE